MKNTLKQTIYITIILALFLSGCNYPGGGPTVTPTFTATFTPLPPTPVPPTDTPTPLPPPTETPTPIPPTATLALPTPIPVIPTATRFPTKAVVIPLASAKFEGTFEGGSLILRVGDKSNTIVPKIVNVRSATCNEGRKFTDTISFEPPPIYPVTDGAFNIVYGDIATISGIFATPTSASGTISLRIKSEGKVCTIGPIGWRATATQ